MVIIFSLQPSHGLKVLPFDYLFSILCIYHIYVYITVQDCSVESSGIIASQNIFSVNIEDLWIL